jgi:hypothetical protein
MLVACSSWRLASLVESPRLLVWLMLIRLVDYGLSPGSSTSSDGQEGSQVFESSRGSRRFYATAIITATRRYIETDLVCVFIWE